MTQEEMIELARQAGFERLGHDDCDLVCYPEELEAFAKLVAEKERESCANICEEEQGNKTAFCALKIRARGQE